MSKKLTIKNLLSSIQMNRKDKNKLINILSEDEKQEHIVIDYDDLDTIDNYNLLLEQLGKTPISIFSNSTRHLITNYSIYDNFIKLYANSSHAYERCYKITKQDKDHVTKDMYVIDATYQTRSIQNSSSTSIICTEYLSLRMGKDCTIAVEMRYDNENNRIDQYHHFRGRLIFTDTVYSVNFIVKNKPNAKINWSTDSVLDFKPNHAYVFDIDWNMMGVMKEYEA